MARLDAACRRIFFSSLIDLFFDIVHERSRDKARFVKKEKKISKRFTLTLVIKRYFTGLASNSQMVGIKIYISGEGGKLNNFNANKKCITILANVAG